MLAKATAVAVGGLAATVLAASAGQAQQQRYFYTSIPRDGEPRCNNVDCPVSVNFDFPAADGGIREFRSSAFDEVDCSRSDGSRTVGVALSPELTSIPVSSSGRFEYHGPYTTDGSENSTNRQLDLVGQRQGDRFVIDYHVRAELPGYTTTCVAEVSRTVTARQVVELEGTVEPEVGRAAVAEVVSGTVRIKRKGSRRFVKLTGVEPIPIGSIIDTRKGRVRITVAVEGGRTQSAEFYDGVFQILQKLTRRPVAEMKLVGRLESCGRTRRSSAPAQTAAPPRGRKLWGSGKGRFRTTGKRSAATVRGTKWLVQDRCDGSTLTRVRQGRVTVRDFAKRETVTLRSGQRYVAKGR